jgi:hypothetical protein
MKFNKWTLGLAAVGVVSLTSAARADEKMNSLQTALSNTTISGSVSVSANLAITPGNDGYQDSPAGGIPFQGASKQDGFNLDVVRLTIAKPEDESPWASGYQVDLMFGPDAVGYNPSANGQGGQNVGGTSADFAIKQAYVTLRTPVGNGIDWKIGVFDTIIGYEVTDSQLDPNYTRSWGYAIEPTEHTGVLATYKINDDWSVSAGIANTLMAGINARDNEHGNGDTDWHKALMASVTYTAPSSWGWAAGSSFYAGIVYGFNNSGGGGPTGFYAGGNQVNYYAGVTLNTPWKPLTTGFAFDYAHNLAGGYNYFGYSYHNDVWVIGAYATYKVNDKLSFDGRAEYLNGTDYASFSSTSFSEDGYEFTATMEYDMWANVMSRLELRWDHVNANGLPGFAGDGFIAHKDSVGLYANIIYKF